MENIPMNFILTLAQIKAIYLAGVDRGLEEECSYQHGSFISRSRYRNLEEVLVWDKETYLEDSLFALDYYEKLAFWNKMKDELDGL